MQKISNMTSKSYDRLADTLRLAMHHSRSKKLRSISDVHDIMAENIIVTLEYPVIIELAISVIYYRSLYSRSTEVLHEYSEKNPSIGKVLSDSAFHALRKIARNNPQMSVPFIKKSPTPTQECSDDIYLRESFLSSLISTAKDLFFPSLSILSHRFMENQLTPIEIQEMEKAVSGQLADEIFHDISLVRLTIEMFIDQAEDLPMFKITRYHYLLGQLKTLEVEVRNRFMGVHAWMIKEDTRKFMCIASANLRLHSSDLKRELGLLIHDIACYPQTSIHKKIVPAAANMTRLKDADYEATRRTPKSESSEEVSA